MDIDKIIQARHSVRRFTSKKPDWRDIVECIDAARYAPMAGNMYSVRFIVVDDKEKIQKLADASQQSFIAQAHYVVVVCTNSNKTINAYEDRAKKYCTQQVGAAIQNFLLKIQESKLATCWIGHFVESQVKEILHIPNNIEVEAMFPIGYEFGKTSPAKKIDLSGILYFNKYENKKMNKIAKLNV